MTTHTFDEAVFHLLASASTCIWKWSCQSCNSHQTSKLSEGFFFHHEFVGCETTTQLRVKWSRVHMDSWMNEWTSVWELFSRLNARLSSNDLCISQGSCWSCFCGSLREEAEDPDFLHPVCPATPNCVLMSVAMSRFSAKPCAVQPDWVKRPVVTHEGAERRTWRDHVA